MACSSLSVKRQVVARSGKPCFSPRCITVVVSRQRDVAWPTTIPSFDVWNATQHEYSLTSLPHSCAAYDAPTVRQIPRYLLQYQSRSCAHGPLVSSCRCHHWLENVVLGLQLMLVQPTIHALAYIADRRALRAKLYPASRMHQGVHFPYPGNEKFTARLP